MMLYLAKMLDNSLYMKFFSNLIVLSSIPVLLCAQLPPAVQIGLVRELNSGKKPIKDVQIVFEGAVPTSSDQSGEFRLVFPDKKPGELIFMTEILKAGYELVNKKELLTLKISNTEQLGIDIILAKSGTVDAAKKQYYNVSDKALYANFEKQKQDLKQKIKHYEITQQDYEEKLNVLQDQYDSQKKKLDALAERFARVNFDDVSVVYRDALELFKTGKVNEAIKKLEDVDLLGRSNAHLQEREKIAQAKDIIASQKAENEKGIQEDIKAMLQQASIYVQKGQDVYAEPLYDQLLILDTTSLEILLKCAHFYKKNSMNQKALALYPRIIAHTQANDLQKAQAILDMEELSHK